MPATHVYANGQEIASKAVGTDGVSASAFPDPCWSPPAPAAGPVVIPYPNTCYAESITNGTQTVMIMGETSAIEKQSRFDISIGDEPATAAFAKGVATGKIKGKGYFTVWSSDVIFEGLGVPRHLDLVTHNHGSMPSNTPTFPYVSRGWGIRSHACQDEERRIERACAAERDHSEARSELRRQSTLSRLLRGQRGSSNRGTRDRSGWHWTDDHCDGLGAMLNTYSAAREYANKLQDVFKALPDELNLMNALREQLTDMAVNAGENALMRWGAKAAAKQLAGSSVPAWGNAAMGLWSVWDAAVAIGDVSEIRAVATESLERLDVLRNKASDLQRLAQRFGDPSSLTDQEVLQLATEGQDILATLNDCTRARKCNLVPHTNRDGANQVEPANNGGCCPGQTGHHLIPEASLTGQCRGYHHGKAPTVCVEGFTQNHGSHKRAHEAVAARHRELARAGRVAADGTMSMDDAIDAAADAHRSAFPLSNCSRDCIKQQLKEHYEEACPGTRPRRINGQARLVTPAPSTPTTPPTPRGR
jgi:hypothetical protein